MEVKRGDIILAALPGDYGKIRPTVIIQSDAFNPDYYSFAVCPITSELRDAPLVRITLDPSPQNGLRSISQIMVDKPHTLKRERCGKRIGALEPEHLDRLDRALTVFLGLT